MRIAEIFDPARLAIASPCSMSARPAGKSAALLPLMRSPCSEQRSPSVS